VRQAKVTVKGALDRDIVRRIVRAHLNEVRYCYQRDLQHDPSLQGRVEVQFSIDGRGSVTASSVHATTMKRGSVAACVAKAARRWKFPTPRDGARVTVNYPFVFTPG
jgi:TonB family protein